jgi:hypothetical protein
VRGKGLLTTGLIAAALAAPAGSAQGAVTIGSNLNEMNTENNPGCGVDCTVTNLNLPAGSLTAGGLVAPVNGVITSWRARANDTSGLSLRVLRQTTGTTFTGLAESTGAPSFTGVSDPIPTSLPISIGDTVGLDNVMDRLIYAETPGASAAYWNPPLANNTALPGTAAAMREVLVQATIEPTNTVTFGALTRNKKKGTATVTLTLPNPGQLSYSGTGVNVTGPASVAAPGDVQLTVRATGKKAKKLKRKGKVSVSFGTTLTPSFGGASITPDALTLRKKLKK